MLRTSGGCAGRGFGHWGLPGRFRRPPSTAVSVARLVKTECYDGKGVHRRRGGDDGAGNSRSVCARHAGRRADQPGRGACARMRRRGWTRCARADVAVLCLPDDAAREAVAMAEPGRRGAQDSGRQHRAPHGAGLGVWLCRNWRRRQAGRSPRRSRVANPGCYATGGDRAAAAAGRGRAAGGRTQTVTINAVSGYSGGGKAMIAAHLAR